MTPATKTVMKTRKTSVPVETHPRSRMITTTSLHSEALASSKPGSQYSTTLHVLVLPVYLNYPYHVSPIRD